jgi:Sulfotransferase family
MNINKKNMNFDKKILFTNTSVVTEYKPPVVVVGLPRSGSSFLSYVLSTLDDWYVFDDLYAYQSAQTLKILNKTLTAQEIKSFLLKMGWPVKARIKWENNFLKPQCSWEDVDLMQQKISEYFSEQKNVYWHQVLEEFLSRLAVYHGSTQWGYKTPQDFMHMNHLTDLFPGIRFIFIVRDPRKMMNSLKNLPMNKGGDGDRRQYHPLAYALYWKMAQDKVFNFIDNGRAPVKIIKFEDLVSNPDLIANNLAEFLNTKVNRNINKDKGNTSFQGQQKLEFTSTENWICELINKNYLERLGYEILNTPPRLQDIGEIVNLSCQFTFYQIQRIFVNKGGSRASIKNYIKNLLK